GALVVLANVHSLYDHTVLVPIHAQHRAFLIAGVAADDAHPVALHDLVLVRRGLLAPFALHHSTSGASETIFMYFFSLSSRPTGPKMRVPRGSPCWLISTAALSSKRM